MNYLSVPIIAGCCYIIGEIYKVIFKNKKEWYKIIPITSSTMWRSNGSSDIYNRP